jgi:outer membrane protein, multidrug efflux system
MNAELRASEEDRKTVMTTVVGDVATGYFSLLELDSELDIDKRTLATREDSLRLIKLRQQGGLAQTRRNELLSLVQLYKALGGGWQQ